MLAYVHLPFCIYNKDKTSIARMSIGFLLFFVKYCKKSRYLCIFLPIPTWGENYLMMEGDFKILISEIRTDEIGINSPMANSLATGWVTYLNDLTHELDVKLL
jgi:hypothetical protein